MGKFCHQTPSMTQKTFENPLWYFKLCLQWHIKMIMQHLIFISYCKVVANGHGRGRILEVLQISCSCSNWMLRSWNCSTISKLNKGIKYLLKNKESLLLLTEQRSLCHFFLFIFSYFCSPWVLLAYFGLVSEWIEEYIEESVIYFIFSSVTLPNHSQKRHYLLQFQKQIITS